MCVYIYIYYSSATTCITCTDMHDSTQWTRRASKSDRTRGLSRSEAPSARWPRRTSNARGLEVCRGRKPLWPGGFEIEFCRVPETSKSRFLEVGRSRSRVMSMFGGLEVEPSRGFFALCGFEPTIFEYFRGLEASKSRFLEFSRGLEASR